MRTALALLISAALLQAAHAPALQLNTPQQFAEQPGSTGTDTATPIEKWWDSFSDPILSSLIQQAVHGNLDLELARQRVLESRAQRRIARAALLPSVNNSDSFDRIRGGFEDGNIHITNAPGGGIFVQPFESNLFQIGFDASWEIDFFGQRRHELHAATAEAQSAAESRNAVLLTVLGDVSSAYMDLRGAQQRLAIVQRNLALQQDSLHLTEVRANAGLATQFDVARQHQQVDSTASLIPDYAARVAADIHALSVLLGKEPAALRDQLAAAAPLLTMPSAVPVGLPGSLLERRPDLRRARMDLIAAGENVGAAKADLFPKIVLTGAAGRQATDLSGFTLGGGNFFSVGPGITMPIFAAGRIRAKIAVRQQQLSEAETTYRQALLQALRETEDALSNYGREQERAQKLTQAVDASKQAEQLSRELYSRGLSDFLSVLDAQREELANEDALAQSETAVRTDLVALYKALGGGWQNRCSAPR